MTDLPRLAPGTPFGLVQFHGLGHPAAQMHYEPSMGLLSRFQVTNVLEDLATDAGVADTEAIPGLSLAGRDWGDFPMVDPHGFSLPLAPEATSWIAVVLDRIRPVEVSFVLGEAVCPAQLRCAVWAMRFVLETEMVPLILGEKPQRGRLVQVAPGTRLQ